MRTTHLFAVATLFASAATFAADTGNVDLSKQPAAKSRAEVALDTERALVAGEIQNGPLVDMYALVEPRPAQTLARQTAPSRKDADTRVAAAPTPAKK